jgi:hypothetical protein
MKKSKVKEPTRAELQTVVLLFATSAQNAFKQLASTNYYSYAGFWDEYKLMYEQLPETLSAEEQFYFLKTNGLHLFYQLDLVYLKEIENVTQELLELNPTYKDLLKALFLVLDFGNDKSPIVDLDYVRGTVESVKKILKSVTPQIDRNKSGKYSPELFNAGLKLLRAYSERLQLQEMADLYFRDEFVILRSQTGEGFSLKLIDEKAKCVNHYILNDLKTYMKREYKKGESQTRVSEQAHFQKHDENQSSDKGLTMFFHSSNMKITSQTPGIISKQVDDKIFKMLGSADAAEQQAGILEMELIRHEQHFHYNFRQALAEIYQPNDEIDIHALHIKIDDGEFLTLFELLAAAGALVAFSNTFAYWSPMIGLSDVRRNLSSAIKINEPELNQEEILKKCDSIIACQLPDVEKHQKGELFVILSKGQLVGILSKVEELKDKSKNQLEKIIQIFSAFDNSIPYNIIYEIDHQYYFSYKTCATQTVVRDIYDYFITDRLFNTVKKTPEERKIIDEIQKGRETRFTNSLKTLFGKLTDYTADKLEFPDRERKYDFGELIGDTDVVAYFEEEHLLIAMQVKLSNRPSFSEKRKLKWVEDKIEGDGTRQVSKDAILYSREVGLKFLADKIGFKKKIDSNKLIFYPLIVTDNFFVDHDMFEYSDEGCAVLCVSFFELEHLLTGIKIHPAQDTWEPVMDKKSGLYLKQLLEENCFWSFLKDYSEKYQVSKSLKYVDVRDRIHLVI